MPESTFQCHTSNARGGREQEVTRHLDATVNRKTESCPVASFGMLGVTCNTSTRPWAPPIWVQEKKIAPEKTVCATRS